MFEGIEQTPCRKLGFEYYDRKDKQNMKTKGRLLSQYFLVQVSKIRLREFKSPS
uniref:Uncharacterized protein n=1 Tax=Lepeophtheirus salmonis TaxID=72036 RepID=A0A0K2V158_LEPSM